MTALTAPDLEDIYLYCILSDETGLDLAEFAWDDPETDDNLYRAWDFQWDWYSCRDTFQVDQGARALGKTVGIKMRAFAFCFNFPGQHMLITAPELNHLRPLTSAIENALETSWLTREMRSQGKSNGIVRQPHWECNFLNRAKIVSRLPNKDGKGVKGCCAEGTLITTRRGQVPIEDVVVGDEALTHLGRWRKVLATYHWEDPSAVEVVGGGHKGLVMSESHNMAARRNRNPQRTRNLDEVNWISPANTEDITRWYLGSPTQFLPFPIPGELDGVDIMRLAGVYVADGSVRYRSDGKMRGFSLTDDLAEVQRLFDLLAACGVEAKVYDKPSRARRIDVEDRWLTELLVAQFGVLAEGKHIPTWLLGAPAEYRSAFLDGYLAGDGHWDAKKDRWQVSSASKPLIIGLRLLGQSLGYTCGYSWVDSKVTHICGTELKKAPQRSHRLTLCTSNRNAVIEDGISWQKIRKVRPIKVAHVYDLTVEEDHSYIADGLISCNQHTIQIELDEAQDYPLAGWIEIVECLNRGLPGAGWRCHGVPRGVRDRFYEITMGEDKENQWTVHRPMAMNRPHWSLGERNEKIRTYGGSRQAPDYKRNIYGEHGDATNPLFVLARLMACVDQDTGTEYNADVYRNCTITFEELRGREPAMLLDLPGIHKSTWTLAPKGYSAYFAGMDVGATNHPSEILLFGQRAGVQREQLDLLLRVHMQRISMGGQETVIAELFRFYGSKLQTFGIDKTGIGFGIWESLERKWGKAKIKGYNFSEKRPVALEDRPLQRGETNEDLVIERNIVEFASDALREVVDAKGFLLPNDRELLLEWQGQAYTIVKSAGNPYGKREFSQGKFHTLDAAKMMIAGKRLATLDELLNASPVRGPVFDVFVGAAF